MTFNSTEYMRKWRANNKDKLKKINEKYYRDNLEKFIWYNTKRRAAKENIFFNLKIEDIVIPEYCPILKVRLEPYTRYSPSVDKVIPSIGYTKDNIQIISFKANVMKNDATQEELNAFADWVKKDSKFVFDRITS